MAPRRSCSKAGSNRSGRNKFGPYARAGNQGKPIVQKIPVISGSRNFGENGIAGVHKILLAIYAVRISGGRNSQRNGVSTRLTGNRKTQLFRSIIAIAQAQVENPFVYGVRFFRPEFRGNGWAYEAVAQPNFPVTLAFKNILHGGGIRPGFGSENKL